MNEEKALEISGLEIVRRVHREKSWNYRDGERESPRDNYTIWINKEIKRLEDYLEIVETLIPLLPKENKVFTKDHYSDGSDLILNSDDLSIWIPIAEGERIRRQILSRYYNCKIVRTETELGKKISYSCAINK